MDYSVFDWALEKWRVFRAPARDDGLFDPVIPPRKCDQRFGLAPEAACVGVPPGAPYVGVSATPRGRVAVDAKARSQARATLPSGLGSIGISIGGLGEDAPQVQPGLLARALNWVKAHPFLTGGVILVAAMAAQQHGLISNRRKSRRRKNTGHRTGRHYVVDAGNGLRFVARTLAEAGRQVSGLEGRRFKVVAYEGRRRLGVVPSPLSGAATWSLADFPSS